MAQLTICDETFGGADSGRRVAHQFEIKFDTIRAADLIRLRVERAYEARSAPAVLTPEQLKAHLESVPPASLEEAVDEALRGFASNAFFLIVNGRQVLDPDETIALDDVNSATFLKLIPLKGG